MKKETQILIIAQIFILLILSGCHFQQVDKQPVASSAAIVTSQNATAQENLAAKEIRRYLYLRTGKLLPIVFSDKKTPLKDTLIIVAQKDRPVVKALLD